MTRYWVDISYGRYSLIDEQDSALELPLNVFSIDSYKLDLDYTSSALLVIL